VTIIVHGARGELTLDAVIDTGFDGDLCLPVPVAIELGLELYGAQRVQLADGSIRSELVFIGKAGFAGQPAQEREQEREILLTEAEDALIGVGFLADWRLEIDFPKGAVYLHSH
jgi:predicted aspartyl protease